MLVAGFDKEDFENGPPDHIEPRTPSEQLASEELLIRAAANIYTKGLHERAMQFFAAFYEAAQTTAGYESRVWCNESGELIAIILNPGEEVSAMRLLPDDPERPFQEPIAKTVYYYQNQAPGGYKVAEPTFYFGNSETAARLQAREPKPLQLDELKTAEDILKAAAASGAWGRKEAANGVVIQNGQAWGLQQGQLVQLGDGESLYELLKRIKPDSSLPPLSEVVDTAPATTVESGNTQAVYVRTV